MATHLLSLFVVIALAVGHANSGYVITTPRRWTMKTQSQVCVSLTQGTFAPEDFLRYNLTEVTKKTTLTAETSFELTEGESNTCFNVTVPYSDERDVTLNLDGSLGSDAFKESVNLTFVKEAGRTFIQTDKYLFKPGQKVQIRILSVNGPDLKVVTDNYEEVYVNNPSRTRIAQWLNVSNSAGLVHLDFDLFDEVEEGSYTIGVKFPDKRADEKIFRVEDYVLPRYEVTVEAPKNILGSDTSVTIKLCARYTFGEPVRGNATLSLAAGSWRIYANLTESKMINGCENFTFPTDQLLFDQNNCHIRISSLKARARVVEDGTDVQLEGRNDNVVVNRVALQFRDESGTWPKKPYLPTQVNIKTLFPDRTPATQEKMQVCTYYNDENVCRNFTTCNRGYLSFIMPSQINSRVEIKAVNYPKIERNWNDVMSESRYYKYSYNSEQYVDSTNSSLTVFVPEDLKCVTGQRVKFTIPVIYVAEEQASARDVHVQVISRGQVVSLTKMSVNFGQTDLPFKTEEQILPLEAVPEGIVRGFFNVSMDLPPTVSPKIKVLVWYSTADGTIVADSREVGVTECLPHNVDFTWSADKVEPGQEANLVLKGAKDALCSIGVVDKSVELLASNNKLDIQSLLQVTYNSEVVQWDPNQLNLAYCRSKYGDTVTGTTSTDPASKFNSISIEYDSYTMLEAIHMFKNAGYFVITNLKVEKLFCDDLIIQDLKSHSIEEGIIVDKVLADPQPQPLSFASLGAGPSAGYGGGAGFAAASPGAPGHPPLQKEGVEEETQERSYLPETWLWLLKPLSATGELNEAFTLPDTITEWVGGAVCVHPSEGVGISGTSSITTFTPFFVDLTLPSTATRGEILPIKISVFNYLDEDLPVKVFVEASEDFEFVEGEKGVREICVKSKDKTVETIKVLLSKIADVNITIEASSQAASGTCGSGTPPVKKDRFVRSLPVEPEGYLRERTWSKYVCTEDLENAIEATETWVIATPTAEFVEGSDRAWITAMGDLMGPTLENVEHLVSLPSGCGEQNMVRFAPNIFVLKYLKASKQDTEFLTQRLTRVLNHGYQRQLTFRHGNDGSYSTFGDKDSDGSTWLTAFVVKSFAQARPYTLIDEDSLKGSADWLKGLQGEDGCFELRGRVINKRLQGGIRGSGKSEPLLAAFVLGALVEEGSISQAAIASGVNCINTDTSEHPYNLALRAYSLALAKAPYAKTVIDQLLALSVSNSSDLRWTLPDRKGEATSLHVETAAYALLALVNHDYSTYAQSARKIVRWISGLRNGQGGFISTQDTVVALQALAAFEESQPTSKLNMVINGASATFNPSFTVTDDNKFLQQRTDVPSLPANIDLSFTGEGCALLQGVLRYNVLADSQSEAFTLKVNTSPSPGEDCKTYSISACTSYTLSDEASNMAILEVKLVSGYIPLKPSLKEVVGSGTGTFKRYEVDGRKVIFYLEEVTSKEVCADFEVYQEVEIENAKPGSVTAYDYYQPEYISTQKFSLDQPCPAAA